MNFNKLVKQLLEGGLNVYPKDGRRVHLGKDTQGDTTGQAPYDNASQMINAGELLPSKKNIEKAKRRKQIKKSKDRFYLPGEGKPGI
jgi:hypothetical protein